MDKITQEELKTQIVYNLPEWYQPMYNGEGSCPWCENFRHEDHDPSCTRALVQEILSVALDRT